MLSYLTDNAIAKCKQLRVVVSYAGAIVEAQAALEHLAGGKGRVNRILNALFALVLLAACEAPTASVPIPVSATAPVAADARAGKVQFTLTGTITQVSDGDTLSIASATGTTIIRMSDMDTPEVGHGPQRPGQRFGRAAESSLKSIAPIGAQVRAECYERDQYQRSVCTVFVGSQNLNLEQIERGWGMLPDNPAWIRDPRSAQAEALARQARKGVWQIPDPQSPADWRYRCWQLRQCAGAEA